MKHTFAASACLLLLFRACVFAAEPELAAHFRLEADARDSGPNQLASAAQGVRFESAGRGAAIFDGRAAHIRVEPAAALRLGKEDFSVALWVHTAEALDDDLGDLVSLYDPARRTGFNLALRTHSGVTSNQSNTRQIEFGIDANSPPQWTDLGRPGETKLAFGLAAYAGELYAGTCSNARDGIGRVYRYAGNGAWVDCGAPDKANAISALAVHEGKLYAASSKYRFGGSALPESENSNPGGGVYGYEGDGRWKEIGRLPQTEAIGGLVVFRGKLHASSLYKPAGFFRYEGDGNWTALDVPNGRRVAAMCVYNGYLWASCYDGGYVHRFDGKTWQDMGQLGENTQTYSFAVHQGRLYVGTWPSGRVYRFNDANGWEDTGRLGEELEVMGMLVHNGKLYGGTLPLAQVYRYDGDQGWTLSRRLDDTPEVKYRRAWTMAVHQGQLVCSTLPSGRIFAMQAGLCASVDRELAPGWRHVAAVRQGGTLRLYVDGKLSAEASRGEAADYDLTTDAALRIGAGAGDYFNGKLRDVRLYRGALSAAAVQALFAETQSD